ncbi:chymotrypsin-2-like, partial [Pogonomyrmex barbatus]|uniref:Chymotrypsin-2-like n=1 Tax=Pogonomyrmex barbatus TaxID=144034 RepID=A0A6I9WJM5_9HYME
MKQLACILIALAIVGVYGEDPEKLVNGYPVNIEDNPQCVSIQVRGSHFCGGSIISDRYILTAGHCVDGLNPYRLPSAVVVTGTSRLSSGGQSFKIKRMVLHENYNARTMDGYDIGLIELATPIQFNARQRPVCLTTRRAAQNDPVKITAWGSTGYRQNVHDDLRQLTAVVMPPNVCRPYHQRIMSINEKEFCTLIRSGTGACNGDSGSGVVRTTDGCIIGL